ncbi:MAG: 2-amino-4-hydroxy-6-hydroxymethyldihydropteridine diphosphokinase [Halieaceae bacterium]|jgi:2-amino-4-hydroxy-6-hydroxymethyldihydropteridine diphosphokinase|nr:2-amino-4-hydroxy-6-hydroxymethyldihydropteridine diphosphokinase [Halieaceae bacterium]
MTRAYIALGSNLGDSRGILSAALAALDGLDETQLVSVSPAYRSAAIGPGEQPDYINLVALLETRLPPAALLRAMQAIERDHGRERRQRWAARTLDLDMLLYGNEVRDEPELTLPHPRMTQRDFVLVPLADLDPELALPCGTTLASLLQRCPRGQLSPLGEAIEAGPQ